MGLVSGVRSDQPRFFFTTNGRVATAVQVQVAEGAVALLCLVSILELWPVSVCFLADCCLVHSGPFCRVESR